MNKELCFCIEGENLYLEQVLVDYMEIPIFFLCKKDNQYYVSLCTNIEELYYVIVKVSDVEIYNLLHGIIPMRNVFLRQKEYWEVLSGEEISLDCVTRYTINHLDITSLPEENACFKALTDEMELYVREFDNEFLTESCFVSSEKKADLDNILINDSFDVLDEKIEEFIYLSEYLSKSQLNNINTSTIELKGEYVSHIINNSINLQNTEKLEKWKNDEIINMAA